MIRATLILACLLSLTPLAAEAGDDAPPLLLAEVYDGEENFADWWVSEKLDGVRAYWDGERLSSRGGNRIAAPDWFTAGWPRTPMDGELWAGRGNFELASGTTRALSPDDAAWKRLRYMVFDLPAHAGDFDRRLAALRALMAEFKLPSLAAVEQFKVADRAELDARLQQVVAEGGEGLMLHRGASLYAAGRSGDLLKLKTYEDAEAIVVGHLLGQGKYQGLLGALLVQRPDGVRFRIGTGFSDEQRRHPPALGVTVTYAYNGLTAAGLPRFARFMRVRDETPRP